MVWVSFSFFAVNIVLVSKPVRQELSRHLVFGAASRSGVVERVFFEKDLLDVISQMIF
jgi:hypothetical protein